MLGGFDCQRRNGQAMPPGRNTVGGAQALLIQTRNRGRLDDHDHQQECHGQCADRTQQGMQQHQHGYESKRPRRLERRHGGAVEQGVTHACDRRGIALQCIDRGSLA